MLHMLFFYTTVNCSDFPSALIALSIVSNLVLCCKSIIRFTSCGFICIFLAKSKDEYYLKPLHLAITFLQPQLEVVQP